VAVGEIGWSLIRCGLYVATFLVVAWLVGAVHSWWVLLALPAATLIGFAFSAVAMFATTFMRSWADFDYVTLAIQPTFLFSATFFPLATYPGPVQWVVQVTPLYDGVALERALMLGEAGRGLLMHVAYLGVLGLLGLVGAGGRIEKLLLS
jgi:lipooligosaccharide transport system permease protein